MDGWVGAWWQTFLPGLWVRYLIKYFNDNGSETETEYMFMLYLTPEFFEALF